MCIIICIPTTILIVILVLKYLISLLHVHVDKTSILNDIEVLKLREKSGGNGNIIAIQIVQLSSSTCFTGEKIQDFSG